MIPALVGVAYGMLGRFSLAIDWPVYGGLAGAVVLISAMATVAPARWSIRSRNN